MSLSKLIFAPDFPLVDGQSPEPNQPLSVLWEVDLDLRVSLVPVAGLSASTHTDRDLPREQFKTVVCESRCIADEHIVIDSSLVHVTNIVPPNNGASHRFTHSIHHCLKQYLDFYCRRSLLENYSPQESQVMPLHRFHIDVSANQDDEEDTETFQIEYDKSSKKWAIRTNKNKYWCLKSGGGIQAASSEMSSNCLIDIEWMGDGTVTLKAENNCYIYNKPTEV
ncbi:hypothetical protein ScPMuIL_005039 [Solemya velum]